MPRRIGSRFAVGRDVVGGNCQHSGPEPPLWKDCHRFSRPERWSPLQVNCMAVEQCSGEVSWQARLQFRSTCNE